MTITHAGFAAIIGRPNVGKSTLINHLLGKKISIISAKPQTTRWQILGIKTKASAQIIYIDTPGLHQMEKKAVNRYMNRVASAVIYDADVVVMMVDATGLQSDDGWVFQKLEGIKNPVILAINKVDLLKNKEELLPLIAQLKDRYPFAEIIPISAKTGIHVDKLEDTISKFLPESPALYPEEQVTDRSIRFQLAEIIREKIIQTTEQELPYTTAIEIEQLATEIQGRKKPLTKISAIIWVERPGQKAIIIGKNGQHLKEIGTAARLEMELLLNNKVFLQLWVKVKAHWTDDDRALRSLGYE